MAEEIVGRNISWTEAKKSRKSFQEIGSYFEPNV